MTDAELRFVMLQFLYDSRKKPSSLRLRWILPASMEDLPAGMSQGECERICQQLAEHGLINWEGYNFHSHGIRGNVKINAFGVDVIEGSKEPLISLVRIDQSSRIGQSHHISVNSSQRGQTTEYKSKQEANDHQCFEEIASMIDRSSALQTEKNEAKSLLIKVLGCKAISSALGTRAGHLAERIGG